VKYADSLVLLAKEEMVLQGTTERLIDVRRFCGMKINVKKTDVMRISRQPSLIRIMINQKQLGNVEYFNCLGSMIINYTRCTKELKSRIAMAKAAFKKEEGSFHQHTGLKNLRKELVKFYVWSIALYGAETWTHRKVDQKCLERF
jgi:hypothetical protein